MKMGSYKLHPFCIISKLKTSAAPLLAISSWRKHFGSGNINYFVQSINGRKIYSRERKWREEA